MTELPVLPTDAPESAGLLAFVNADPDDSVVLRASKVRFFLIEPVVLMVPWLPVDTVDPTVTIVVEGDASPTFRSSPLLSTLLFSPLTLLVPSDFATALEAVTVDLSLLGVADTS